MDEVLVVRQCNLDATFLPYRKTNRRIQPFDDPGFPESMRKDIGGPRDLIGELSKDFADIPPQHDHDGNADFRITVPHATSEDAAALFMPNSSAGSGMVLPHQETLGEGDTNASTSDRTNAPVRRGFRACRSLTISDLDDQGLRAFFETFRLALLLPRNWYPNDRNQYAI